MLQLEETFFKISGIILPFRTILVCLPGGFRSFLFLVPVKGLTSRLFWTIRLEEHLGVLIFKTSICARGKAKNEIGNLVQDVPSFVASPHAPFATTQAFTPLVLEMPMEPFSAKAGLHDCPAFTKLGKFTQQTAIEKKNVGGSARCQCQTTGH